MKQFISEHKLILMEAAVIEQLRRDSKVKLHPRLLNAPLIYDNQGRLALKELYKQFIDVAQTANVPLLLCTPTWRASNDRVIEADIPKTINIDAAKFLKEIKATGSSKNQIPIKIGGLIGCKNDCYKPEEGLSTKEAREFHSWQIEQLVSGEVDFLLAATLPNVQEAIGMAQAMEESGAPYIISFVISRDGALLDGTKLLEAVNLVDSSTKRKPLGYMINCAYPSFLCPGKQPRELFSRLIGYQANASSLDHCDLENADELKAESILEWSHLMKELNETYKIKILGGCCGTNSAHLKQIVSP